MGTKRRAHPTCLVQELFFWEKNSPMFKKVVFYLVSAKLKEILHFQERIGIKKGYFLYTFSLTLIVDFDGSKKVLQGFDYNGYF